MNTAQRAILICEIESIQINDFKSYPYVRKIP